MKPDDASKRFSMHAFGAVFVEVAVNPDLGETRVRRIVGAYGAGRLVNPKLARSQCAGGMVGGIGMALLEHSVVDWGVCASGATTQCVPSHKNPAGSPFPSS